MPLLEANNAAIFYETYGDKGPWITLINGHTRSSRDFRLLAKSLSEAGFQCLTFDNRGSGQTDSRGPFTLRDMVQDVYALWDKFGIKGSFVLGISMGGMISQIIASEKHPHIIGLILISTAASQQDLSPVSFGAWGKTPAEVEARLMHYFTPEFASRNKLLVDAMIKQIHNAVVNEDFDAKAQLQRDAIQSLDNRAILEKIQCPTLIIHGDLDQIVPLKAAEKLTAAIKDSEFKIMEGRGHLLLAEDSKGLAEDVIHFCRSKRP